MAAKKLSLRILGVMTGTSCDGLDAACIEVDSQGWHPLWTASTRYPKDLKKTVLAFQTPKASHSSRTWLELHRDLGDWYSGALVKMISRHSKIPDIIANHGQTIAHFPENQSKGMTLQLGDNSRIATATGLSVVSQFREGDMAAGGQGAPLVPLFHKMLAHQLNQGKSGVAIHNIGGISNLTYLGPKGKILAFDTGPGNIWIDAAVEKVTHGKKKFDMGGKMAARGTVDHHAVKIISHHPYFSKPAPKSTGRDEFSNSYFFSHTQAHQESLVATATQVTIESIAQAYETSVLKKGLPLRAIFVCGGGAKNLSILNGLRSRLPGIAISSLSEWGLDSQFIEAQAFALFGFFSLFGTPLGGPWTGAKEFGPPGHLIPGKNWMTILEKISLFLDL